MTAASGRSPLLLDGLRENVEGCSTTGGSEKRNTKATAKHLSPSIASDQYARVAAFGRIGCVELTKDDAETDFFEPGDASVPKTCLAASFGFSGFFFAVLRRGTGFKRTK